MTSMSSTYLERDRLRLDFGGHWWPYERHSVKLKRGCRHGGLYKYGHWSVAEEEGTETLIWLLIVIISQI